jgi:outer membrane receptor protein involved in Fe transport
MKTKNLLPKLTFMLMIALSSFVLGCSSAANTSAVSNSELGFNSLLDLLRRQPNLNIVGSGSNATVTIRGRRSIHGNNEPLFVVGGTPLGNGYNSASSIDVNTVESIQVLSPSQSAIYGARGANGVIKIELK